MGKESERAWMAAMECEYCSDRILFDEGWIHVLRHANFPWMTREYSLPENLPTFMLSQTSTSCSRWRLRRARLLH